MNSVLRAQDAYATTAREAGTPRLSEFNLIADITRRLRAAEMKREEDHTTFVRAVFDNRKLWTALLSDLAQPGNGLPADIKARSAYLAEFTFHQSSLVLRQKASVAPLVEINTAILRGLQTRQVM